GQSGRLILHKDGVEPLQFLRATCEDRDARGNADEGPGRRGLSLGSALGCGNDAALAFLSVRYAHEVLVDVVGEKPYQRRIIAAQDHDVPLLHAPQSLSLEAGELLAGVGEL